MITANTVDWRANTEATDVDPDDEVLQQTPSDVVLILGFDPLEEDTELNSRFSINAEFSEGDHPRDSRGRFSASGADEVAKLTGGKVIRRGQGVSGPEFKIEHPDPVAASKDLEQHFKETGRATRRWENNAVVENYGEPEKGMSAYKFVFPKAAKEEPVLRPSTPEEMANGRAYTIQEAKMVDKVSLNDATESLLARTKSPGIGQNLARLTIFQSLKPYSDEARKDLVDKVRTIRLFNEKEMDKARKDGSVSSGWAGLYVPGSKVIMTGPGGKDLQTTMTHEMAHAIDNGNSAWSWDHSNSPAWKSIHDGVKDRSIHVSDTRQMGEYAKTNAQESFAVACETASKPGGLDFLKQHARPAYDYLTKNKILHE